MTNASWDPDLAAVLDPRVPPNVLADIAARRWDLHGMIVASPGAYPDLIRWIGEVNPLSAALPQSGGPATTAPALPAVSGYPASAAPVTGVPGAGSPGSGYPASTFPVTSAGAPPVPARRSRVGCWLTGCGCLAVVGVIALVGALLGGLGTALAPSAPSRPDPSGPTDANTEIVTQQMEVYEAERTRYYELLAVLDGNPVAPLVSQLPFMQRVEQDAAVANPSEIVARSVAERARDLRADLEAQVVAAEARRTNVSGTLTEQLVDEAGDGFIDVRWDAATECGDAEEGKVNTGCVFGGDPLTIHLQAESEVSGDWERRMVVAHELAHVYQHADASRFDDGKGDTDRLIAQGLFQGSDEHMADCYALTYYGEWSLQNGRTTLGYGYVCNESERQAIREWAAGIHAPMP